MEASVIERLRSTFHEYPIKFWVLAGATFIDGVGRTLVFPFFTLYVTQRFQVGMTEAGAVFAVFAIASFSGSLVGGGLTDRFGRRAILLFGLVFSAVSSLALGLADSLTILFPLVLVVGLLAEMGGPAANAMVADLLPEEQRAEGYGILRVAGNLSWIVGPTLGGLIATQSYFLLFVGDAVASLITAVIVFRLIPETMPAEAEEAASGSIGDTFRGYRHVLADRPYLAFLLIAVVMNLVYLQLYSTLSVYLRDVHAIPARGYGALMSINAATVVLAQFWTTRQTRGRPPLIMMALGSSLYLVGFTMFGIVQVYPMFVIAMLIVTSGEMIVIPVAQALVAMLAPADMRGRYMAVFSISWGLPSMVAPWAAGLILDNLNPDLLWYICGVLSALAIAGFVALHLRVGERLTDPPSSSTEVQPEPAT